MKLFGYLITGIALLFICDGRDVEHVGEKIARTAVDAFDRYGRHPQKRGFVRAAGFVAAGLFVDEAAAGFAVVPEGGDCGGSLGVSPPEASLPSLATQPTMLLRTGTWTRPIARSECR